MCLVYRTETGCVGVQLYSRLGSELATGGVVQPPVPPRTLLAPCSPSFVALVDDIHRASSPCVPLVARQTVASALDYASAGCDRVLLVYDRGQLGSEDLVWGALARGAAVVAPDHVHLPAGVGSTATLYPATPSGLAGVLSRVPSVLPPRIRCR